MVIFHAVFFREKSHIVHPCFHQIAHRNLRQQLLTFVDGYQIKRRKDHAVFHSEFPHHIDHLFFQVFIIVYTVFQLNICNKSCVFYPGQIFPQGWDPLKLIFPFEFSIAVHQTQLPIHIITYISCSAGCPVNGFVVHDHDLVIFRQLDGHTFIITPSFLYF